MKKLFCILLLAATGFSESAAQAPGYQGKRFSVGANASSFFYFSEVLSISDMLMSTRFSYKTEAYVNYTVSRKVTMGFSYYTAKQKYTARECRFNNYESMPEDGIVPAKISIYELNLKVFRKNFVAPAGLYHQFGVGIVKYRLGTDDNKLPMESFSNSGNLIRDTITGLPSPYTCAKLSYHIGRTVPLGHNFFFNTAFGVNFFQGIDAPKIKYDLTPTNYILGTLNKGLRAHNFFEIKVGFGWLAF